jgi:hypothetical protein
MTRITLYLLLALIVIGCSSDDGFFERASMLPQGIVQTDADGRIVDRPASETDWEIAPNYRSVVFIEPAYPNPATVADQIRIPVSVYIEGAVIGGLRVEFIQDQRFVELAVHPEVSAGGAYVLNFPAALFGAAGLYRVFIVDGRGAIVSYGDIRIQ